VSRTKLKDYTIDPDRLTVLLETKSKYRVMLKKVKQEQDTGYYLEVTSSKKALKEQGMKTQFKKRFEEELQKIKNALTKKGGTKTVEKVNQRIGRAKQKHPSAQIRYHITLTNDEKNK
jgi:predicted SPOUT superfamily RNA methylase MTH1